MRKYGGNGVRRASRSLTERVGDGWRKNAGVVRNGRLHRLDEMSDELLGRAASAAIGRSGGWTRMDADGGESWTPDGKRKWRQARNLSDEFYRRVTEPDPEHEFYRIPKRKIPVYKRVRQWLDAKVGTLKDEFGFSDSGSWSDEKWDEWNSAMEGAASDCASLLEVTYPYAELVLDDVCPGWDQWQ